MDMETQYLSFNFIIYNAFAQRPRHEGTIRRWVLNRNQNLYAIEEQLRESRAGPQERHPVRQEQSRPLIDEIHAQLQHSTQYKIAGIIAEIP